MTEPTRTTNPVKIGVGLAWEIKVDNYVHGDDIDTTSEDIRRDETASFSTLEVMENSVSVTLVHSRMNEEARVAELANLASQ